MAWDLSPQTIAELGLRPIDTCPKDGSYFIAWGPSGYTTTPMRAEVCRHDARFRPRNPIVNHANDAFTDGGEAATHWSPLPFDIKSEKAKEEILELKAEIRARKAKILALGGSLEP